MPSRSRKSRKHKTLLSDIASHSQQRPLVEPQSEDKTDDGLERAYALAVINKDNSKVMPDNAEWDGTGSMIFTALFSVMVAFLLSKTGSSRQQRADAQTLELLAQAMSSRAMAAELLAKIASSVGSSSTLPAVDFLAGSVSTPKQPVLITTVWSLSLMISIICTLLPTLGQGRSGDISRNVLNGISNAALWDYSLNRIFLRMGIAKRSGLHTIQFLIIALMHIAIALFLTGVVAFIYSLDRTQAIAAMIVLGAAGLFYSFLVFAIVRTYPAGEAAPNTPLQSAIEEGAPDADWEGRVVTEEVAPVTSSLPTNEKERRGGVDEIPADEGGDDVALRVTGQFSAKKSVRRRRHRKR